MHYSAARGATANIGILSNNGANLDARNINGSTPLHIAAANSSVSSVKKLVSKGADISIKDNRGWAASHIAARNGMVEVLPDLKNSLRAHDERGFVPRDFAVFFIQRDLIKAIDEIMKNIPSMNNLKSPAAKPLYSNQNIINGGNFIIR